MRGFWWRKLESLEWYRLSSVRSVLLGWFGKGELGRFLLGWFAKGKLGWFGGFGRQSMWGG